MSPSVESPATLPPIVTFVCSPEPPQPARHTADAHDARRPKDARRLRWRLMAWLLLGLTFDMSGGPKGAKRPLERPLDGGVRPHCSQSERRWREVRSPAA